MTLINPFIEVNVHPHIFNEYDLQINKVSKIKSTIKVESETGTFAFKKTKISSEQFNRMVKILDYLDDNRFPTSAIIPNKYGDLYVPTSEGIIYATKWTDGRVLSLNDYRFFSLAVSSLANLHKIGYSFRPNEKKYQYIDENSIKKVWIDSIDWLKKYQKKLKSKNSCTAFEHIFLTYLPFIQNWAEEAVNHFNDWIIQYNSIKDIRKTICHGQFYHNNIIITPEDYLVIIDFDKTSIDTQVKDLSLFIKTYLFNKEYQKRAEGWFESYQRINPLLAYEKKLLSIYLIFPEKIINLAKRYEKKLKSISDDIYFKKLQVRWAQTRELIWFADRHGWLYE